ncbi:UNVERIFIED_CONTAM: hypothetical protein Sradi_0644000 [Sesamum radiatum]|uniref:Uncharacterized protein n=1 Tax=Sesamum radiatum TaxID=300843 RepID=A0AAW2VL86_SESRA
MCEGGSKVGRHLRRHTGEKYIPLRHKRVARESWCIVGPRLCRGRSMCLARVGPLLKSVAQSMCQCPAMIPHGTPKVPSCLPTRLHICPQCGAVPRPTVLANGPPCTAVSASHELDHEVLPRSPFAREVLPLISRSPRSNLASGPEPLGRSCPNVGRPGPTPPVRFPCLSGTLNTPLRCLE